MPTRLKLPWQRNFRKIPERVLAKVESCSTDEMFVECVKKIALLDIERGIYAHLGGSLVVDDSGPRIVFPEAVVPDARAGRYSNWNVNGRTIVRRDLPKVLKSMGSRDVPIYGDSSKGYVTVTPLRMVFQRESIPAARYDIVPLFLTEEAGTGNFVFRFRVDHMLNRSSPDFAADLQHCLNLLQENVGAVDLFPAVTTIPDYLKTQFVNWELLPPGEEARERILSGYTRSTDEVQQKVQARFELLMTLSPVMFINGTNGFDRYFGAKFSDNLVVFENVAYGNALYAMDSRWGQLSQLSRTELLSLKPAGFTRIPHTASWEDRLREIVLKERGR